MVAATDTRIAFLVLALAALCAGCRSDARSLTDWSEFVTMPVACDDERLIVHAYTGREEPTSAVIEVRRSGAASELRRWSGQVTSVEMGNGAMRVAVARRPGDRDHDHYVVSGPILSASREQSLPSTVVGVRFGGAVAYAWSSDAVFVSSGSRTVERGFAARTISSGTYTKPQVSGVGELVLATHARLADGDRAPPAQIVGVSPDGVARVIAAWPNDVISSFGVTGDFVLVSLVSMVDARTRLERVRRMGPPEPQVVIPPQDCAQRMSTAGLHAALLKSCWRPTDHPLMKVPTQRYTSRDGGRTWLAVDEFFDPSSHVCAARDGYWLIAGVSRAVKYVSWR